eukprot:TRINITY_DN9423_c0_g1_i2.p1 TRINITY_DN9423_c0_g1~~TRINITY_DN9423_c0_g1_i2.p1  ORF type:complete len:273 (-),score=91.11 TRINITY_DN9423_c0_g1_i2:8-826(-)
MGSIIARPFTKSQQKDVQPQQPQQQQQQQPQQQQQQTQQEKQHEPKQQEKAGPKQFTQADLRKMESQRIEDLPLVQELDPITPTPATSRKIKDIIPAELLHKTDLTAEERLLVRNLLAGIPMSKNSADSFYNKSLPKAFVNEYGVGFGFVDSDHKKLFDLIDMIVNMEKEASGFTHEVILALEDYAHYHFSAEEQLMKKYGWEKLPAHHGMHVHFTDKVNELALKFSLMENHQVDHEFVDFLRNWLANHIKHVDKEMIAELVSRGADPEETM